ncbi:MAG: peptidoglycan DD-metalloendopeptidase family protein [Sandaracinaceae bacterium]|nr:peptidoglycan DD-metalloendopeptidase family protein [Sandaracinaceae bacterium]
MSRHTLCSILSLALAAPAAAQLGELSHPMRARVTMTAPVSYAIDRTLTGDAYWAASNWRNSQCEPTERIPHTGVDLDAPEGTPVFAAAAGTVETAISTCPGPDDSTCEDYGNYVTLSHGTYYTRYAHLLEGSMPVLGTSVECGQFLGVMGDTGNSFGSHLHFEVRKNLTVGRPVLDAYGGMCALQVDSDEYNEVALWAEAMCDVSDIAGYFAQLDFESETQLTAGPDQPFAALLVFRNIGSVAWEPGVVDLRNQGDSGVGGVPALLPLPGASVPACSGGGGCTASFRIRGTAPSAAGTYQFRYQLFQTGVPFPVAGTFSVTVQEGECYSPTLERRGASDATVPVGACVQTDHPDEGTGGNCGWYVCARPGSESAPFAQIDPAACAGATYPNATCGCELSSTCNTCADESRCAWDGARCVAAAGAPATAIRDRSLCDVCPEGASMCIDSTMRVICEGERGIRACAGGYEACVCRAGELTDCLPCSP